MTQLEALYHLIDICSVTALNGYDDSESEEACDIVCAMIEQMEKRREKAREKRLRKNKSKNTKS